MQLSLYHQLLSEMVNGNVDTTRIYRELKLDSESVFGDGFLVEVGETYSRAGILSFDELLDNNTLTVLSYEPEADPRNSGNSFRKNYPHSKVV
jgi:Exonuclease V - a 5' deoxyribonuclease